MSRSSNGNICGMIDSPGHRLHEQSPTSIYSSSVPNNNLFSPPGQYSPLDARAALPTLAAQRIRTTNLAGRGAISNSRLPPLPPDSPHSSTVQALLRQQLQQQSGSHTPTRSYDSYASTHNNLEPSGVFNSSSYELPGRQTAANNSGGMPDASNYGLGSWHASQGPGGSPMMCTPPRSPQIMGYTSPRGTQRAATGLICKSAWPASLYSKHGHMEFDTSALCKP